MGNSVTAQDILSAMARGHSFLSQLDDGLVISDINIQVVKVLPYIAYEAGYRIRVRYLCCGRDKTVSLDTLRERVKHELKLCGPCRKRQRHIDRQAPIRRRSKQGEAVEAQKRQEAWKLHEWAHKCMSGRAA